MSKRKTFKEMFDAVERGVAFTVYGKDGEPLAMVIPWADWQALNKALVEAEERLVTPGRRTCTTHRDVGMANACAQCRAGHPERCVLLEQAQQIPEDLWGQGDVIGAVPPGSTVLDLQTGAVHQEPGSWTKDWPAGTESP